MVSQFSVPFRAVDDWKAARMPVIPPQHGSEYLVTIVVNMVVGVGLLFEASGIWAGVVEF